LDRFVEFPIHPVALVGGWTVQANTESREFYLIRDAATYVFGVGAIERNLDGIVVKVQVATLQLRLTAKKVNEVKVLFNEAQERSNRRVNSSGVW
jgi:hypothetical protein